MTWGPAAVDGGARSRDRGRGHAAAGGCWHGGRHAWTDTRVVRQAEKIIGAFICGEFRTSADANIAAYLAVL